MLSDRGFSLIELVVVSSLILLLGAIALPVLGGSTARNSVWSASELIGSQIRQARLKAISRNMSFRVRFNCPATGQFRVLAVTGDSTIDNATDRCSNTVNYDSGIMTMPDRVTYGTPPTLTVDSRGAFTSTGSIPAVITVSHSGSTSRSLNVSSTGQIAFSVY